MSTRTRNFALRLVVAFLVAVAAIVQPDMSHAAKRGHYLTREAAWGDNPIWADKEFCATALALRDTDPYSKYAYLVHINGHNQYVDVTNAAVVAIAPHGEEVCRVGMSDELQDNGNGAPSHYRQGSALFLVRVQVRQ